jgi:hypothetical protein
MRPPAEPEAYLRVWVAGGDAVADGILDSLDQRAFSSKANVRYLGSARIAFEQDVPKKDRCQLLIGLRGPEEEIRKGVDFVNARQGVDADLTQVLWVESLIVSRTAPGAPLDLFDE